MNKILLNFIFILLLLGGCREPVIEFIKIAGYTQGTTYHITYQNVLNRDLQPEIDSLLREFDMSLSTYIDSSLISEFNKTDKQIEVDEYLVNVFNTGREVWEASGGAFDMSIAPLVNAWGFGFTEKADVDSGMIDSILAFTGMEKLMLSNGILAKADSRVMLDPNAIAQGYSVDVVSAFLEANGIHNYLVEIGGELKAKGSKAEGETWKIGVDKPLEGNMNPGQDLQIIVGLKDKALATSGNYRKFYEKDGQKYAHTINPQTGYPVMKNLLSATILTDECMVADAYATACMVVGLERAIAMIEKNSQLDAYFIYGKEDGSYGIFQTRYFDENVIE